MKLISGCLVGIHCRFDGGNNYREDLARLVAEGKAVPVCPEQLGGLPTPRYSAEIQGAEGKAVLEGKSSIVDYSGEDVTDAFRRGAEETLALARLVGAEEIILKENSPSCGVDFVFDGTFSRCRVEGPGLTTALLQREGFRVISEEHREKE